ncbi:MAG: VOC family protein [Rhodobacteraceae bacterium]|nr:VOC family protein [Paracoccaceae bacterium]MBR9821528.1 VOC family protein [Paracoccaceae bacterium]
MTDSAKLDHIVVASADLDEGVAWVEQRLGLALPAAGGKHPLMGTHNRLMRLGEASFLEVIAPDPDAEAPTHPRWFGLDHPPATPRLAHWLVRWPGLTRQAIPGVNGPAIRQRRGDLSWLITVPEDGTLPHGGAFPSFLDWEMAEEAIPPRAMPSLGFDLTALRVTHPEAPRLAETLAPVLQDPRVSWRTGAEVALSATLAGPTGDCILD